MPFKSEKQRRFMHAKHPKIAKQWEKEGKMPNTADAKRKAERKRVDEFTFKQDQKRQKARAAADAEKKKPKKPSAARAKQVSRSKSFGFGSLLRALGLRD